MTKNKLLEAAHNITLGKEPPQATMKEITENLAEATKKGLSHTQRKVLADHGPFNHGPLHQPCSKHRNDARRYDGTLR